MKNKNITQMNIILLMVPECLWGMDEGKPSLFLLHVIIIKLSENVI